MGQLTTHVLDTMAGRPADGVRITLWRHGDGDPRELAATVTNPDGRTAEPLLAGDRFTTGQYELHFYAGDYLRAQGLALPQPAFLDVVPIRFGIADSAAHYHVPLLLSPFGYSTYRGS